MEFSDGTKWSAGDVASRTVAYGTDKGEVLGNVENYGGNDTIHAGGGDDEVYAGDGDDKVYGEAGDDKLYGSSGKDILEGEEGNDLLDGGVGDDILVGGADDDVLKGNYGSNTYLQIPRPLHSTCRWFECRSSERARYGAFRRLAMSL